MFFSKTKKDEAEKQASVARFSEGNPFSGCFKYLHGKKKTHTYP